jgi:hypothetical protein
MDQRITYGELAPHRRPAAGLLAAQGVHTARRRGGGC